MNLVPYLDIVTNIILFLMMTTAFGASLAVMKVEAASRRGGDAAVVQELHVDVSENSISVALTGATGTPEKSGVSVLKSISRLDGRYDLPQLERTLRSIRQAHSDITIARLSAEPNLRYEDVVEVMDAVRGRADQPLFPDLALGVWQSH